MLKSTRFLATLATYATFAASPSIGVAFAQNVLQADLTPPEVSCPRDGQTDFIPGLALGLKTSGNPVQVTYNIGFRASPTGIIHVIPVIDGVFDVDQQLDRAIGDASGQADVVAFSRLYRLPKGSHTFSLMFSCQSAVQVVRGWLTVYELPRSHNGERD